jgi:DNA adenine methylase
MSVLPAPFPYFGGKRRVADMVWSRFGDCRNYVEPFFGSGAVLLGRPTPFDGVETVNDADGLLANFWRALRADPDAVADHADHPVNENDLHARHSWLVGHKDTLQARLEGDPDYHDAKIAGWWVWGMACWIGAGFCSGKGPWQVVDGQLVHLGDAGRGVKRQLVHLGNAGQGVNRKREDHRETLFGYFRALADRLRHVRVCCGDWTRVMGGDSGEALQWHFKASGTPAAIFLDPPYAETAKRASDLYRVDSEQVAHKVREWAIAHGDDPRYRIALCGYDGEHAMPDSWDCVQGKGGGGHGFGGQAKAGYGNRGRERIWFSPHCVDVAGKGYELFGAANGTH